MADNLWDMSCRVCQIDCRLGAMSTFFGLGKDARAIDDGKAQGTDTDAAEQSEQSDEAGFSVSWTCCVEGAFNALTAGFRKSQLVSLKEMSFAQTHACHIEKVLLESLCYGNSTLSLTPCRGCGPVEL